MHVCVHGAHTRWHTHAGIRVLATGQADVFVSTGQADVFVSTGQADVFVRTGQADVFAYEYVGYALSRLEGEIPSEDGCVPCRAAPRHAVPACARACMCACMRV